jgi:hypothetical protein
MRKRKRAKPTSPPRCRKPIPVEWEGHMVIHRCTKPSGHVEKGDPSHVCKFCPITLALTWVFKS